MRAHARSRWVTTDPSGEPARDTRQSGQGNIEYIGMVVAVAVLIVALIAVFPSIGDNLTCKFSQAIAAITGGSAGCSGGGSEAKGTEDDGGGGDPAVAYPTPTPWRAPPPDLPQVPGVPHGLDPNSDLVKTMQSTSRGRDTLRWLDDNGVKVYVSPTKKGAVYQPRFPFGIGGYIVMGSGYDNAATLIHETNHAKYDEYGRSATARLSREDFIDARIAEETDGTVQEIQAAKEFRAAGHNIPTQNGETEYDNAYNSAKAGGASDVFAEQMGYDAVRKLFDDGVFRTSNTNDTYSKYYGKDWDSRPCLFGRLGC